MDAAVVCQNAYLTEHKWHIASLGKPSLYHTIKMSLSSSTTRMEYQERGACSSKLVTPKNAVYIRIILKLPVVVNIYLVTTLVLHFSQSFVVVLNISILKYVTTILYSSKILKLSGIYKGLKLLFL